MAARIRSGARDTVKSADRVLDVLELLADAGRLMTHAGIAERTAIPKSSLTHLLRNLLRRGYVTRAPDESRYGLGDGAFALARRGQRVRAVVAVAQPLLEQLTRETGESSALSLLRGSVVERVCSVNSTRAILYSMHVGVRAPLYAVSTGKVFLAWMAPEEREAYLARVKLEAVTPRTVASVAALRRQLRTVREEGVAYSVGEFTQGIIGVAVPVNDGRGRAVAALGVALPAARFDERQKIELTRALRGGARTLAQQLRALWPNAEF